VRWSLIANGAGFQPGMAGVPGRRSGTEPSLLRRQVWLRCGRPALAWAESWWNQTESRTKFPKLPAATESWRSLSADRAELFRESGNGLATGASELACSRVRRRKPLLEPPYVIPWRQGKLTVIREGFLPRLLEHTGLGPSSSLPRPNQAQGLAC